MHFNLIPMFLNAFATESKSRSSMLEKSTRLISRTENKEGSKSFTSYKTAQIRETKASRLRAASITSPNGKFNFEIGI